MIKTSIWVIVFFPLILEALSVADFYLDKIATTHSPCLYGVDKVYGGIWVDCQGQGLKAVPPSDWIPSTTTTLLLQGNLISYLDKDSFQKAAELRHLSMVGNKLTTIHPNAFRMNKKLRVLNLNKNYLRLDNNSFTQPWFTQLCNLVELHLGGNHNDGFVGPYRSNLLEGLTSLRTLSLDTFIGDLTFNGVFNHARNLTSLTLSGGVTAIRNCSFLHFADIKLKDLNLLGVSNLEKTETGAFRYLTSLDSYTLVDSPQGMKKTLESLAPFLNRKFTRLRFIRTRGQKRKRVAFEEDSVMTRHIARFLSGICVKEFEFKHNFLHFIELGVLTSPIWTKCLVSLDLSGNPIFGDAMVVIRLKLLRNLRYLHFTDRKYSAFSYRPKRANAESKNFLRIANKIFFEFEERRNTSLSYQHTTVNKQIASSSYGKGERQSRMQLSNLSFNKEQHMDVSERFGVQKAPEMHIFLSERIVYMDFTGYSEVSIKLNCHFTVSGGQHLQEIHVSDSGIFEMTGSIKGFESVKVIDVSKNDGSKLTSSLLSSFRSVSILSMSNMNLHIAFSSPDSHGLFHNLSFLESLDLSDNGLFMLPSDTFSQNKQLKFLKLAKNRFKYLPKLDGLPNLQMLDLRSNSFLQLSADATFRLEQFAKHSPSFSVQLEGNIFACSCSRIRFLHWIQTTRVSLDNARNYSCILENGQITNTAVMEDIPAVWRQCVGKTALLTALILLLLMALSFSLLILFIKLKTQLTAVVYQFFNKNFILKTPQDYPIGVYVGYCSQDSDFACGPLRQFIEGQLHLRTYIHQRDLLPGTDAAGSMVTAINSSWRVLLVMSQAYLDDQWSFLAMKTAMYSVSSANPGRVVLVLLSEDVSPLIPSDVLNAVNEKNIISIEDGIYFKDCQKEFFTQTLSNW